MITDTCRCGAMLTIQHDHYSDEQITHIRWMEAHAGCRSYSAAKLDAERRDRQGTTNAQRAAAGKEDDCASVAEQLDAAIAEHCKNGGRMVFWTCPNGCSDFVDWYHYGNVSVATCRKCGQTNEIDTTLNDATEERQTAAQGQECCNAFTTL